MRRKTSLLVLSSSCVLAPLVLAQGAGSGAVGARDTRGQSAAERTDANVGTGQIIISEFMANAVNVSGTVETPAEWFELYNPGTTAVNLKNWVVSDTTNAQKFTITTDLFIQPGDYLVFGQAADLGGGSYSPAVNFSATADYVYPTTGGTAFTLANSSDSIVLKNDKAAIISQVVYSTASGSNWPGSVEGAATQLTRTLLQEEYVEAGKPYWCHGTTQLATINGTKVYGTPGAANIACQGVDVDLDGYPSPQDCDDANATRNPSQVEIPDNDLDNDCDGVELFTILVDPGTDSSFGLKNELTDAYMGWSATDLVFAWDYTLENNAVVWYFDLGLSGGENNFLASSGYAGAFPTNFRTSRQMDLMMGSFGTNPLYLYKLAENASTDITASTEAIYPSRQDIFRTSYLNDGSAGSGFVRIPWDTLYGLGAGKIPTGLNISLIGLIRGSDNTSAADIAPNNPTQPATTLVTIRVDRNSDGLPDVDVFVDEDSDGYLPFDGTYEGDCDPTNPDTYPNAQEMCDDADNDCDTSVDEGVQNIYYVDGDGDGYGDESKPVAGCVQPPGAVLSGTFDCDDEDNAVYPGAAERCSTAWDDNCNGQINEASATDAPTWYKDADGDGWGNTSQTQKQCTQPTGFVSKQGDCDDSNAGANPNTSELCSTAFDDNCDGAINEDTATDAPTWYADTDADSYGDAEAPRAACTQPDGHVADDLDCDDSDGEVNPDALEYCDALDNDCDELTDEDDAEDAPSWYADLDEDDYGDPGDFVRACTQPEGRTNDDQDCDDTNDLINPAAAEICNGADDNCDTAVDSGNVEGGTTFFVDFDLDGYGDPSAPTQACGVAEGLSATDDDCDDINAEVHPDADESCNEIDDDCDGLIDDADDEVVDQSYYYADSDGDGWGDEDTRVSACERPDGYIPIVGDCDDTDPDVNPQAQEIEGNGKDDDCNRATEDPSVTYAPTEEPTAGTHTPDETEPQTAADSPTEGVITPPETTGEVSPTPSPTTHPATDTPVTETEEPTEAEQSQDPTDAPVTDPPATDAPATDAPVTDAPTATPAGGTPTPEPESCGSCTTGASDSSLAGSAMLFLAAALARARRRR